ncbi:amino acid adenylation domain-containing protein [Dactylosporangium sp. NPDC049742]|uniref:amino acid adenylation domain-containing protein n=1 Tax=Dactylosporangium sp. NPDC049742 TaxID=3154737 RepID=UPI0034301A05
MSDLAERLASLSPQQRARFEQLMLESDQRSEPAALQENLFPLSVLQQGMWFLEQLRPNNPAYVVPGALRIRGPLDRAALLDAANAVVSRHEALRTTFELRDGRPTQVVHASMPLEVPEIDLRPAGLTGVALEARIVTEALGEPMHVERGPLLRLKLLRTGPDEAVLVLALHHLVSDRWSIAILMSEIAELYEAAGTGRPSRLAAPAVQYGDFAVWQQEQLRDGRWDADLAYWRQRLAGAPSALELPTDRPRPAVQGFNGAFVPIHVAEPLLRSLGELAHRHGATTYMALLAAFTVLLHRYSNQDDVVVGMPTAMRGRPEIESLIGYFVNALPIRTDVGGNPPFTEVLDRVRLATLAAYTHEEVPFDVIVAGLQTARDLSRPPVFQVSFSHGREPAPTFALGDTELTRIWVQSGGARFDLELQTFERDGALGGWFEYDRDLFDEATIARMAGHLQRLIGEIVADPQRPIDLLDLVGDEERRGLLAMSQGSVRVWPDTDGWVHECFERRAAERPDAEAVRFAGRGMTYAALNRRANQLARRLIRAGVGRDVLVGVSMERSPELVVALLAVLKAGGAYVPLDPEYPPARLEHMLAAARVPVVLTQRRILADLPALDAEILCLDELGDALDGEPDGNPCVAVGGEDLAYVIFTSGSTGTPKGVMNVHAGIRNRLLWMQEEFGLQPADRVLQKTPFSFDVSVWEFFWPLMTGATLVVARPGGHRDGAYLADIIRTERVTTMHFVPSMLQVFLQEPVERCTSLRRVICSGEALPRDLRDRFMARSPAQLSNLYGPTEAAVDVTHWTCHADEPDGPVPIGRPIANTEIYVLDRLRQLVPTGVAGELYIGGRNLARGYLDRPDLTAEWFVEHPFDHSIEGPAAGARLYRTGDLARFRADGAVEFLGRLDHQVKLRGLRIELGEIEAALTGHPQVHEAVVVAREHRPGDLRLVAYLTPDGDTPPSIADLVGTLRLRLPEYMVPACFEILAAFPLTASGKVDRNALPEPTGLRPDLGAQYVAPRDDLEDTIAGLWREILGVERVGMHDSFFDLGGHSLLMARLRTELAARTGHDVSMVELFQHPTVGSLAGHLRRAADEPETALDDVRERAEHRRRSHHRRRQLADARTRLQER